MRGSRFRRRGFRAVGFSINYGGRGRTEIREQGEGEHVEAYQARIYAQGEHGFASFAFGGCGVCVEGDAAAGLGEWLVRSNRVSCGSEASWAKFDVRAVNF